ncbi:hypothetical protein Purlil1_4865 [Purpureocillium lilacinum]|uniref:Uncharacterized protein n=1 Tax=Purpureocillium lilacinum TaxID=33203 RepID=A0ABR0C3L7_PURLI|nr:hypothetical protein Purlil1_4865 [Purpureocillium lilacinum]
MAHHTPQTPPIGTAYGRIEGRIHGLDSAVSGAAEDGGGSRDVAVRTAVRKYSTFTECKCVARHFLAHHWERATTKGGCHWQLSQPSSPIRLDWKSLLLPQAQAAPDNHHGPKVVSPQLLYAGSGCDVGTRTLAPRCVNASKVPSEARGGIRPATGHGTDQARTHLARAVGRASTPLRSLQRVAEVKQEPESFLAAVATMMMAWRRALVSCALRCHAASDADVGLDAPFRPVRATHACLSWRSRCGVSREHRNGMGRFVLGSKHARCPMPTPASVSTSHVAGIRDECATENNNCH